MSNPMHEKHGSESSISDKTILSRNGRNSDTCGPQCQIHGDWKEKLVARKVRERKKGGNKMVCTCPSSITMDASFGLHLVLTSPMLEANSPMAAAVGVERCQVEVARDSRARVAKSGDDAF